MEVKAQAEQEYALQSALRTPEGRFEVGQTLLEPFKEGRDYVGLSRKLFFVDMIPQGAPMWYDKDPQFSAVTIAERGSVPITEIYGERVVLDPYPITVLVRIPTLEVAVRRFNILDREQVRARAEMAEVEDSQSFSVFSFAALRTTSRNPEVTSYSDVSRESLSEAYANVESNDAPPANVVMHAQQYRDIRNWDGTDFDPVSRRELIKTGYVGDIWNASIRLSKIQTVGTVFVLADPEFLGVLAVRIDLDQMEAPNPQKLQYGWVFYEYISQAVITDVGVCQMTLS
jgi:hypothetical protein